MKEKNKRKKEIEKYILNGTDLIFEGIQYRDSRLDGEDIENLEFKTKRILLDKLKKIREFSIGDGLKEKILNKPTKVSYDLYFDHDCYPINYAVRILIDGINSPDSFTIEYSDYLLRTVKNDNLHLLVMTQHNLNAFFSLID